MDLPENNCLIIADDDVQMCEKMLMSTGRKHISGASRRCPTNIHCDNKGHVHDCQEGRRFPY